MSCGAFDMRDGVISCFAAHGGRREYERARVVSGFNDPVRMPPVSILRCARCGFDILADQEREYILSFDSRKCIVTAHKVCPRPDLRPMKDTAR